MPLLFVFLATLLCVSASAGAQPAADIDALLAMPPAPGVEALLFGYAGEARVTQRWRDLLRNEDVRLRLTAARLLGAANARPALGGVRTAIDAERDPQVQAELLRTLAIIGSEAADPVIYRRLSSLSPGVQQHVLAVISAMRPDSIRRQLGPGGLLTTDAHVVRLAYEQLARRDPGRATQVELLAMHRPSDATQQGLLRGAVSLRRRLPAELVAASLGSADQATVRSALDYVAALYDDVEQVTADAALMQELEARGLSALVDARLSATRVPPPSDSAAAPARVAVLSDIPAPIVLGLSAVTRCAPSSSDERVIGIQYGPDGRPVRADVGSEAWSLGCARMARAIYSIAYGHPARAVGDDAFVLLRMDRFWASCLAEAQTEVAQPPASATADPVISPPRRIGVGTVPWPARAPDDARSGIVVDAHVTRSGCVAEARVEPAPWLDEAALRAVSRWRFVPARAAGAAVPAEMQVTVRFSR